MITGLRKFIFSLVVFGGSWFAVWFGKISGDNFVTITIATIGIFTLGNVVSGVGGKVAENLSVEVKQTEVKQ